eukprot:4720998-Prorocentrum_lima.AAC.1
MIEPDQIAFYRARVEDMAGRSQRAMHAMGFEPRTNSELQGFNKTIPWMSKQVQEQQVLH